jgi:hypothetical protein
MYDCADPEERSGKKRHLSKEDKEQIAEYDELYNSLNK